MKILLFANTDWYLFNYRLRLAQALVDTGHEVILVSPPGQYGSTLTNYGLDWRPFPLSRRGINPVSEIGRILRLANLYRKLAPDVAHQFTIKCVLYGSFAAKLARVPRIVNAITGRGYVFSHYNWGTAIARILLSPMFKIALKGTEVIFQNKDDLDFFLGKKFVCEDQAHLIPGSGVDLDKFRLTPIPTGKPIILLPSRMLWSKGVGDFITAASMARENGLDARFVLAGEPDSGNPDSIPIEQLKEWDRLENVEWWGWQKDMAHVYQQAAVVCLPTYYGEGIPKSLIEGAACGRPLIATDLPGCQEVIRHGTNGYLVPKKNEIKLAEAIENIVKNKELAEKMGKNSRRIVENKYSTEIINKATISIYNELLK